MQRNQFVELLKNFELIFETGDENKRLYIAPQYLPDSLEDEAQELYEMVFEDLSLAFVFRFPKFMPDNIMINFLSRYGPFSKRMYWKKGICFTSDKKVKCSVVYDEKDQSLSVYTSKSAESLDLHYEICQAFVELSKNTHAEISVDGHAFASWQELKKHAELYEKDPNHQFFAVDGVTHLCMKDFAVFVGKGDMRRYLGGEKTSEEPIKNKEKMELNSLKQQVKSYIGVAKPEKAIEVIETWAFNQGDNDAQTAITMIKADWNNLQRERNIGILDNGEVRQRNAIINNRLLEFMWTTDTTLNPRVDVHINPPTPSPTPDLDGENTPPNPTKKKAISFLTADPKTLNQIGASVQKQKIEDIVKGIFEFDDYMNTKYNEIGKYIVDKEIVHITVHGKTGELFFIHATAEGEDNAVTSAYLCRQFKNVNQVKELVMLIACNSETTAQALFEQGLAKYVVGTTMPISVKAAIDFSAQFYTLLKDDFDIPKVFDNTCFELNQDKLRPKYDTDEGGLYDYYKVFKLFH